MIVEIRDLRLVLGGRPVLNGVDLTMRAGDIYGFLGPNGAGKSTTISVLAGLRPPASGKVEVLGRDPVAERTWIQRRIGVLSEQSGFYEWMGAAEYLMWFSGLSGKRLGEAEATIRLHRVGLDGRNRAPIGTYSRGMKQRLGLARALLNDPELLILDEPTNGLDPRGRREIHDVLLEMSVNDGVGILLCTHLLDDVDRLCTHLGILSRGKTVLEGPVADLLAGQRAAARYRLRVPIPESAFILPAGVRVASRSGEWWHVELSGAGDPATAWRELLDSGLRVEEIHQEGGGLEELYLAATETREAV